MEKESKAAICLVTAILRNLYIIMRKHSLLRIALLLGQDLGHYREVLAGVLRYQEEQDRPWLFQDAPPDRRLLSSLLQWQPHGIIGHFYEPGLVNELKRIGIPCVSTTMTLRSLKFPAVDVENAEVGRLAADYFLERGYRHFAYLGSAKALYSTERLRGYKARVEAKGYGVEVGNAESLPYLPLEKRWDYPGRAAERWLRSLPPETALLVSNDLPARSVVRACLRLGRRVPQEIAVMGVDNDEAECRMTNPPLTSIALPGRAIGYEAAKMMDAWLQKGMNRAPAPSRWLAPLGIVERASTEVFATNDPALVKALRFIHESSTEAIGVPEVAAAAGISRRTLENRVRTRLSLSVLELIHSIRLRHARRLLVESDLSITELAHRSGFSSLRQFELVFTRFMGTTPTSFRHANL